MAAAAAAPAVVPSDDLRVAVESFRPYWDDIMRLARLRFRSQMKMPDDPFLMASPTAKSLDGRFDIEAFLVWAGINRDGYDLIMRAMKDPVGRQTLPFGLVDQVMVSAGMEWAVTSLYVVQGIDRRNTIASSAPPPRAGRTRFERAQQRRERIKEMWMDGASMAEIADELGTSVKVIGVKMAEMRRAGWDLPYRRIPRYVLDAAA